MEGPASKRGLGEPVSAPVAVELGENTGWELWTQAVALHEAMPSPNSHAALEALVADARRGNRVCPQPAQWLALYKLLLQHAARTESGLPPRMLTGAAWSASSALDKRLCLRQQLEWAHAHGCLPRIAAFLGGLQAGDWYRME